MWWSKPLLVVVLLALGPVGCGFRPLYAKPDGVASSAAAAELATIRVAGIDDRIGQQLRNGLVQRLTPGGETADARYLLTIKVAQSTEGLAATNDGHVTLGRTMVTASYTLAERDGVRLKLGTSRAIATYRTLGPRYGTIAVERDTEERAVSELAEDIRSQLAVFFANGASRR
jgi:LPS-assembly lipoprotein